QGNRAKPELCKHLLALHMYMVRLAVFIRVEKETIRSNPKNCRHVSMEPFSALIAQRPSSLPAATERSGIAVRCSFLLGMIHPGANHICDFTTRLYAFMLPAQSRANCSAVRPLRLPRPNAH